MWLSSAQHSVAKVMSNVHSVCRGFAAVILQVLYYAAPLSTFGEVISKKSSASLYPPGCFMNTVNSALWAVYGIVSQPDHCCTMCLLLTEHGMADTTRCSS